jgi:hypothetical protein
LAYSSFAESKKLKLSARREKRMSRWGVSPETQIGLHFLFAESDRWEIARRRGLRSTTGNKKPTLGGFKKNDPTATLR